MTEQKNEFLDRIHFEIPERKLISGREVSQFLRGMKLIAEIEEVRDFLRKRQGFAPDIKGKVEDGKTPL